MKFTFVLLFFVLSACSSAPVMEEGIPRAQQTLNDLYQRGKEERISGKPDECLKTFNKIVELRKTVKDSLFAYSLYQSGLCYEMKSQYDRAVAVYQDALRVSAIVNSELSLLEIPARLAIAYERTGDATVAKTYYEKVKTYIDALKKDKGTLLNKKAYYAETLFQMGTIANNYLSSLSSEASEIHDFSSYLKSISYSQEYLMMVMELEVQPFSEYAFKQMVNNFQSSFNFINNIPQENLEDEVLAKRLKQSKQKDMSTILAHHIDQFEIQSVIQKKSKRADYQEIFKNLSDIKAGLNKIINERPVGEGLTPEAQKLQDPKKEGRFVPVEGDTE